MAQEIIFCDQNAGLIKALMQEIADHLENVDVPKLSFVRGDITEHFAEQTAVITPCDVRLGFSGGLDAVLLSRSPSLRQDAQTRVQQEIGTIELPIGGAALVEAHAPEDQDPLPDHFFILCAPVVQLPSKARGTNHARQSFLAALRLVEKYNKAMVRDIQKITRIVCPGLGTGFGGLEIKEAANQMVAALIDTKDYPDSLEDESDIIVLENHSEDE